MKYFKIVLIALTTSLTSCVDTKVNNDLSKSGITGNVKELTQYKWTAVEKFGEPTPVEKVGSYEEHFKITYNKYGNIAEKQYFFPNGKLAYVSKNQFNQKNDLTEKSFYDSNGDLQTKVTYTYDNEKNTFTQSFYDKDGNLNSYTVNQMNEAGDVKASEEFSKDDTLQNSTEWKYDKEGNAIVETVYDSDRKQYAKGEYKHNENNNTIEQKFFNNEDSLIATYRHDYEFDVKGNWTKQIIYENDQLTHIKLRTFTYLGDKTNQTTTDIEYARETTESPKGNGRPMGLYKNVKEGIYSAFEFKGESTVVIHGFGIQFPTSYVRDGNLLRIRTDKSDLLLTIIDDNTLTGQGYAQGEYRKD